MKPPTVRQDYFEFLTPPVPIETPILDSHDLKSASKFVFLTRRGASCLGTWATAAGGTLWSTLG